MTFPWTRKSLNHKLIFRTICKSSLNGDQLVTFACWKRQKYSQITDWNIDFETVNFAKSRNLFDTFWYFFDIYNFNDVSGYLFTTLQAEINFLWSISDKNIPCFKKLHKTCFKSLNFFHEHNVLLVLAY
jgi:hypothetical protein